MEFEETLKRIVEIYAPYYRLYRDEIKHEDTLINQRLSWLLFPQAALLTAYASNIVKDNPIIGVAIICIGIGMTFLSSYGILIAIRAGMNIIKNYDEHTKPDLPSDIESMLPGIVGFPEIRTLGWLAPIGFCLCFLLTWGMLGLCNSQGYFKIITVVAFPLLVVYWIAVTRVMIFSSHLDPKEQAKRLHQLIPFIKTFEKGTTSNLPVTEQINMIEFWVDFTSFPPTFRTLTQYQDEICQIFESPSGKFMTMHRNYQTAQDYLRENRYEPLHIIDPNPYPQSSLISPRYSQEELARQGNTLYETEIRPTVEANNHGKIVAIDIETRAFELADDTLTASDRLLESYPDAQIWHIRIGYKGVHHFGVGRNPIDAQRSYHD
jgi:hypothetical protein